MHHCRLHQQVPVAGASHHTLDRRRPYRPREPDHRVLVPPPDRDPRPRLPNRPRLATPEKTPDTTPDPRPTLARTSKSNAEWSSRKQPHSRQDLRLETRDTRHETRDTRHETRDTRHAAGLIFVIRAPRPPPPALAALRHPPPPSAVEAKTRARSESQASCLGSQVSDLGPVLLLAPCSTRDC